MKRINKQNRMFSVLCASLSVALFWYSCNSDETDDCIMNDELSTYARPQLSRGLEPGGDPFPNKPISCGVYCVYELAPNNISLWGVIRNLPDGVDESDPLTPSQLKQLGNDCGIPFTKYYTNISSDTLNVVSADTLRGLGEIGAELPHVIVGYYDHNLEENHYVVACKMTNSNTLEIIDPASNNTTMPIGVIQAIVY